MPGLPVDNDRVLDALGREVALLTGLLRSVRNSQATAIGVWSSRDVAAHMSHLWEILAGNVEGEKSPVDSLGNLTAYYMERVRTDPEHDMRALAERIEKSTESFIRSARSRADEIVPWHGGVQLPAQVLGTILLSEALLHGLDVARAEGREWTIPTEEAAVIIDGLTHLLPHFVNTEAAAGVTARFRLHIRHGSTFDAVFRNGDLTIEPPSGSADCHISADPAAYLLAGYNRIGQWAPIVRGQLVAYGRKPWLGLQLTKLLNVP